MMTQRKLKKLVKSGAIHPIALCRKELIASAQTHSLWTDVDFTKFPWPVGRTLRDLVANVAGHKLYRLGISERHYFRLLGQIEIACFGTVNPERPAEE